MTLNWNSNLEENDNGEVDPSILQDSLKAVIQGRLISRTTHVKKTRMETYNKLKLHLKDLEQKYTNNKNQNIHKQIQDLKGLLDEILGQEVEKKARFMKQAYEELGPKSTKLLARRLQQANNRLTTPSIKLKIR